MSYLRPISWLNPFFVYLIEVPKYGYFKCHRLGTPRVKWTTYKMKNPFDCLRPCRHSSFSGVAYRPVPPLASNAKASNDRYFRGSAISLGAPTTPYVRPYKIHAAQKYAPCTRRDGDICPPARAPLGPGNWQTHAFMQSKISLQAIRPRTKLEQVKCINFRSFKTRRARR